MIREWKIKEPKTVKHCVIGLTGRGGGVDQMAEVVDALELPNTLCVAMRPVNHEWYPAPNGPLDQDAAVNGVPVATAAIMHRLQMIQQMWDITNENVIIMGFSAGGVMAIDVGRKFSVGYAISLAGAVLDPAAVTPHTNKTKFILQHNQDDSIFKWHERYVPSRQALLENKHNVYTLENEYGEHQISWQSLVQISNFLGKALHCKDHAHSKTPEKFINRIKHASKQK